MSQDVSLNEVDYGNIIRWFELAFAKTNKQSNSDRNTFTKLSAMALGFADEKMKEKDDGDEI